MHLADSCIQIDLHCILGAHGRGYETAAFRIKLSSYELAAVCGSYNMPWLTHLCGMESVKRRLQTHFFSTSSDVHSIPNYMQTLEL